MFTFSFGSAFAATDAELAAQTEAMTYAENAMTAAASAQKALGNYSTAALDYATSATAVTGRLLASDLINKVGDLTVTENMTKFKDEFGTWAGIKSASTTIIGTTDVAYAGEKYADKFQENARAKDFEGKVAEATALVEAVDTSVYADSKYTVTETINGVQTPVDYTYRTYADKLKADTKAELNDNTVVTKDNYADTATTKGKINEILYGTGNKNNIVAGQGFFGKLKELKTTEDVVADDARSAANIAYAQSILAYTGKIDYYDSVKVAENSNVASLAVDGKYMGVALTNPAKITKAEAAAINAAIMQEIEKALEVANVYYAEESTDPVKDAKGVTVANFKAGVIEKAKAAINVYKEYEAKAADKKAALLFDGTKMYDDAAVDAALAKDKTEIYAKAFKAPYTIESFKDKSEVVKLAPVTDPVANAINTATDKFQDKIAYSGANKTAEADKKYCKEYYATEAQAKYTKIANDAKDKLYDAKTVAEVESIMADADKKLADLRTAEQQKNLKATDVSKYQEALVAYANAQGALMGSDYRADSFRAIVKKYNGDEASQSLGKFAKAKDAADLAALYEAAKEEIAKIQKDADLKAEAAKIAALLAALPSTVDAKLTTEDKFMEAKDAYEAYLELPGTAKADIAGFSVFESKLNNLKNAQQNAVSAAAKDLADLKPYGLEDKEAVKAVRAQYDKYVDYYDQYDEDFDATIRELEEAEVGVRTAEINNVKSLIMKLTEASSEQDIAAAKKAYDDLTGSQQRAVKAALGEAYLYKLQLIEQANATSVKELKITARSSAKKGSITVKWTVKGDASAADGYQVWKSTKQSKGYKKAITTTKKSYKNTKGLKKGTRYYYKVRAYKVVDGKNVYSDWSNKAYRVAK